MSGRSEAFQAFIDAGSAAFRSVAQGPDAQRAVERVFAALEMPANGTPVEAGRQPVCALLELALSVDPRSAPLKLFIERFTAIEPALAWERPSGPSPTASANFEHGCANAMIVGPGGLEDRQDVWLGVSLLAPHVRYPDHHHPPEEVYLVLSEGEWQHGTSSWFSPGIGGSLYNEPGIKHAMRSAGTPLFAFWALPV